MGKLAITLACGAYDRTRALVDGSVQVDGVDLNVLTINNAWARHQRMVQHEEFDVCELSTSSFLLARDRGQAFVGLPVFPYRMFRHGYVWCATRANVREPTDLRGKRIGSGMYQITTSMWVRGFLQHDYGVLPEDLTWITELPELVPLRGAPRARIEQVPPGTTHEELLLTGGLDALIGVEGVPPALVGRDDVHRLFPDYRTVEIDYYRRRSGRCSGRIPTPTTSPTTSGPSTRCAPTRTSRAWCPPASRPRSCSPPVPSTFRSPARTRADASSRTCDSVSSAGARQTCSRPPRTGSTVRRADSPEPRL
jgi:hypothetical protein